MMKHWTETQLEAQDKLTSLYQDVAVVQALGTLFRQKFWFFKPVLAIAIGKRFGRTTTLHLKKGKKNELES